MVIFLVENLCKSVFNLLELVQLLSYSWLVKYVDDTYSQVNKSNLFKVDNNGASVTVVPSFWCLYCLLWTNPEVVTRIVVL